MTAKVVTLQVGPGIQRDGTVFASVSMWMGSGFAFNTAALGKLQDTTERFSTPQG